jgi:hypothetical protein
LAGRDKSSPTAKRRVRQLILRLRHGSLVEVDEQSGVVRVSADAQAVIDELDLSLAELAALDPNSMIVTPLLGEPPEPPQPACVFVAMPLAAEFRTLYEEGIRPAAQSVGATLSRANEFLTSSHVMQDIWGALCGAEVVISVCTGQNPNVFYETGVAHVLGKPVLLLTASASDVPFDLRHWRFIIYDPSQPATIKAELAGAILNLMPLKE